MELTGLAQVLLLGSYLRKILPQHADDSLGSLLLQVLVDSADGRHFAIFQLAETMDCSEVNQLQESVTKLVGLQSVEGDLVALSSVLVQGVEDAPLLPYRMLLSNSITFLCDDQDSSRLVFHSIKSFCEVLFAMAAQDVLDPFSELFLAKDREAPLTHAFP